jgi:hypothetical protein
VSPDQEQPSSAIRGRVPATARWRAGRDLNNEAAMLLHQGRVADAAAKLRDVAALTLVPDVDGEGLDLRARSLLNLAAAREFEGALDDAVHLADEGLAAAAAAITMIGDERATRTVQINGMIARAQTLTLMDRFVDAFTGIDGAEALLDDDLDQRELLTFSVRNARTTLLILTGRLQEAEDEATRALEVAITVGPELSGHAYANLGVIAQRTGDEIAAQQYLTLAQQAQEHGGDAASRQLAVENLARSAMQQGRHREAEDGFRRAAELAAVLLQEGRAGAAVKALRTLLAELDPDAAVHERLEAFAFLGDAESARHRYPAADDAYRAARDLARYAGDRCRVNLRRAEMHAEWAAMSITPRSRLQRLEQARDLAVPVLLATEALRDGFAPGPVRERWTLQVAAPARELAFRLARTLGDATLLFELVENAAATVTLQTEAAAAFDDEIPSPMEGAALSFELASTLEDRSAEENMVDDDGDELPAAAAGLLTARASTPHPRFAPPPRVIAIPGAAPVLESWIRLAEAEYGVAVRAETAVAAW